MSVNIKSKLKQRDSRADHTFLSQGSPILSARLILFYFGKEHPSLEQKNFQPVCMVNQQSGKVSQVLTIEGCRVKVNYLSSRPRNGKENILGNIQKSLLAACQPK
jgi:hypothetical protein